jgi:hypothetical protein
VLVTHSSASFTFKSVDIYSSISAVNWKFVGLLKGKVLYSETGQIANPMGGFTTVKNARGGTAIDKLRITLSNVKVRCCGNAVGIDNAVVATE